jgi:hypothetical protein
MGGFAARAGHLSRVDEPRQHATSFGGCGYANGIPEQIVSLLVWNGQRGVQIFFAVSGSPITSTTLRRWGMLKAVNVRAV